MQRTLAKYGSHQINRFPLTRHMNFPDREHTQQILHFKLHKKPHTAENQWRLQKRQGRVQLPSMEADVHVKPEGSRCCWEPGAVWKDQYGNVSHSSGVFVHRGYQLEVL